MNSNLLSFQLNILVSLMRVKAEIILKKKYGIDYSQFLVLHVASEMKESSQNDIAQNS